ncbi:MAG: FHA domain-containing protein [Kiritimatiellia bacterium]
MSWCIVSVYPAASARIDDFPFYVGRDPENRTNCLALPNRTVSRNQFVLERRLRGLVYRNLSRNAPATLDGAVVVGERKLDPSAIHVVRMGEAFAIIGTNADAVEQMAMQLASELYFANDGSEEYCRLKK